jgi:CelD/BcsL family acetyltransferase involved in cellulose biosynthesis
MTATATTPALAVRAMGGFDDPHFGATAWDALLAAGDTDVVFLTWHWQRAWWQSFGRGELMLLLAERDGVPLALAPLFADSGMVFFVGAGGSDYLGFVGSVAEPAVLDALLGAARERAPGFLGFLLHHVPDTSRTGALLRAAAGRLGLQCVQQGTLPAPTLALHDDPARALAATRKKSLLRHEAGLRRAGALSIHAASSAADVLPQLDDFFAQHVARWAQTPWPSLFLDAAQRAFYVRLAEAGAEAGWLRFTRLDWNGDAAAYHFGFCHGGSYLWYKPSFDIALARRSPGEVLLRQLLLTAIAEGAREFDFGIGDEPFKQRFATGARSVENWGLYPNTPSAAALHS